RAWGPVGVARARIPRRRRIGMVVGDLAIPDDEMMRQHAADRFGEAAADGLLRHRELLPGLGVPEADFAQGLVDEVERAPGGVGLEVGAGAIALDGVAPLRDLPLEADGRFERGLRQVDLDAVAGRLDVADVD